MTSNRALRVAVAARDGWRCAYCGSGLVEAADVRQDPRATRYPDGTVGWDEQATGVRLATLDHVDDRLRGSRRNDLDNLALACRPCNSVKGDRGAACMVSA